MDAVLKKVDGALLLVNEPSHSPKQENIFASPQRNEGSRKYTAIPQTDSQTVDKEFVGKGIKVGPQHCTSAMILCDVSVEYIRQASDCTSNYRKIGFVVNDPIAKEWCGGQS